VFLLGCRLGSLYILRGALRLKVLCAFFVFSMEALTDSLVVEVLQKLKEAHQGPKSSLRLYSSLHKTQYELNCKKHQHYATNPHLVRLDDPVTSYPAPVVLSFRKP
jgi:hypothetical protein